MRCAQTVPVELLTVALSQLPLKAHCICVYVCMYIYKYRSVNAHFRVQCRENRRLRAGGDSRLKLY